MQVHGVLYLIATTVKNQTSTLTLSVPQGACFELTDLCTSCESLDLDQVRLGRFDSVLLRPLFFLWDRGLSGVCCSQGDGRRLQSLDLEWAHSYLSLILLEKGSYGWTTPRIGKIHSIPSEKEMAIHWSILAWEIPWTEETGGPMRLQRVGHNLVTKPPSPLYFL